MTIINNNTVVVYSFDELKEILENSNDYNYIYFGNNISLNAGIKISSSKSVVTINGTYNDITYQFEDRKTLNAGDTISASSTNTLITVCNMQIIGNNYYGIIYVPDSSTYKNVVVEYKNITYTGPQISFNPFGLTRFIDSTINIGDTSLTTGNEVAECNQIELGGITTIIHKSKSNSSFWFRNSNPSLRVLTNSQVTFVSESRELLYGTNSLTFEIQKNATFNVTTHSGFGYGTNGTSSALIDTNATFILKQTTYSGGYATWYSYGPITLNENSTLNIINNFSNITTSNYNIYFSSSNASFILNNPKEVILYNTTANIIYANTTIPFKFQYTRINLFTTVPLIEEEITINNLPTYAWYKQLSLSEIVGTFTATKTTITTNNYTSEELSYLPALTNFNFPNKRVLSIGDFLFKLDSLTDEDTVINGTTLGLASILIEYNDEVTTIIADNNGDFIYEYDSPLPIGTVITFNVKESNNLIYHTKKITIVYSGELVVENIPEIISFVLKPISTSPILCPKSDAINIKVTDSRVNSTIWHLYVNITHDLISSKDNVLKDSLVFLNENNEINILSTTKMLVYTGEENGGTTKITNIVWSANEGILLQPTSPIINNNEYTTNVVWTIE